MLYLIGPIMMKMKWCQWAPWSYHQLLDKSGGKALAYLASSSVTKKKGFNIDSKGQFYKEISQ